ncbi:hypothetical protein RZN25_05680 [Bacillaceae bacterium S4-13-56]
MGGQSKAPIFSNIKNICRGIAEDVYKNGMIGPNFLKNASETIQQKNVSMSRE